MVAGTIVAGTLLVGAAIPDPPFELVENGRPAGFDIELMQALCRDLGLAWQSRRYEGDDFNGIFDALDQGRFDCVASGTTITAERALKADFCAPYLVSGQSLTVNIRRTPAVKSVHDLAGQVVAVQRGNTSEPVVERLKAEGAVADIRVYPYDAIAAMLDDLEAGRIGAIMKLAPVMRWFTRGRPALAVVEEAITVEKLGIAVRRGNAALLAALDGAQARLEADGTLSRLIAKWTGP